MSYEDIAKAINIDADFSDADRKSILGVIREAYKESSIARDMFDHWVTDLGREIDFIFNKGDFSAWNGKVWLDMDELDNASYIDRNGNAIRDYPFTAIIHELGHALTARLDNWTFAEPAGDNQAFVNKIYRQAGYTEQLAYMAYDASGTIIRRGVDYTDGQRIDSAWVHKWSDLPDDFDSTNGGRFKKPYDDLVIGSGNENILKTGAGDDFIFGLGGRDTLYGGSGDDRLAGGLGADILNGGKGFDFASYKLASAAVTVLMMEPSYNMGEAYGDTYFSIEGLIGSAYGDTLIGSLASDIIDGRRGKDTLVGYSGNERLIGGRGMDTAVFTFEYATYDVDLDKGIISGGGEGRDKLIGVEWARFFDGDLNLETGAFTPAARPANFADSWDFAG